MAESLIASSPVRSAFERIVDYAGLFPPARLRIEAAALEYERTRRQRHAWMLGRFVVPASRIAELESALEGSDPVPLAILLDGGAARSTSAKVRVEACEVALRIENESGAARAGIRALRKSVEELAPGLPVAVEVPSILNAAVLAEAMDALAEAGFAAKLRCGGVTADAVPAVEAIAAFVRVAVHERVPFKMTAGLHHPVRHYNEAAGFTMHGFLNVLAAACFAGDCDTATAVQMLAEEDTGAFRFDDRGFRWRDFFASDETLRTTRADRLLSFGSCSFGEPVEDLAALGMLRSR
jgi:hypothetical protein